MDAANANATPSQHLHTDVPVRRHNAEKEAERSYTRPLIEKVKNRWVSEEVAQALDANIDDTSELPFCDLDNPRSCPNAIVALCTSRRFRRMFLVAVLILCTAGFLWSHYLQPRIREELTYEEGFTSQETGTYGIAKGGDLDEDLARMKKLDLKLLPGGPSDPDGKRRLVFIGDVHGCKKELLKLLDKLDFNEKTDHLVMTGDVVSKGPENVGVLDELIRKGATSVRGNHEDRILHVAKSLESDLSLSPQTSSKGVAKDLALLKQLSREHMRYLRDMPLMLRIPALPQAIRSTSKAHSPISEEILVVHAGIVPGLRLDKQDPYFVMNMRSINRATHVPSTNRNDKSTKPWFDVWNWYNDRISEKDHSFSARLGKGVTASLLDLLTKAGLSDRTVQVSPQQVVYGHDSKSGLQIFRWSKGLDSGCVSGGELTAMVLQADGSFDLHSVSCKNYRG